jgi:hypothetical protein
MSKQFRGFGKQPETKLGYVLLQPEHDDFLSFVKKTDDLFQTAWCNHPSGAKVFAKESVARQIAEDLVLGKPDGYELVVCQISDTKDQYKVEALGKVVRVL